MAHITFISLLYNSFSKARPSKRLFRDKVLLDNGILLQGRSYMVIEDNGGKPLNSWPLEAESKEKIVNLWFTSYLWTHPRRAYSAMTVDGLTHWCWCCHSVSSCPVVSYLVRLRINLHRDIKLDPKDCSTTPLNLYALSLNL